MERQTSNADFPLRLVLTRAILSLVLLAIFGVMLNYFNSVDAVTRANVSVQQLQNDNAAYAASRAIANANLTPWLWLGFFVVMILVWWPVIRLAFRRERISRLLSLPFLVFMVSLTACVGPAKVEVVETIQPNETAFMIPLEGDTLNNQGQFGSQEYLESKKVPAKRVTIPQRERVTGRFPWNYEWIPTAIVVKVDRAPVTREWTQKPQTGTSTNDDHIAVESSDSVNFGVNVTCTVTILEEDAALFLYRFANKKLSDVVDADIRGYLQGRLFDRFARMEFDPEIQQQKAQVFEFAAEETKAYFKAYGITVTNLSSAGGLTPEDPRVQEALTNVFTAEQEEKAQQSKNDRLQSEVLAAATNTKIKTDAETAALVEREKAVNQVLKDRAAILKNNPELAQYEAIQRWNGEPSMVSGGDSPIPFMLNLPTPAPAGVR